MKLENVLLEVPIPCTKVILCDFGIAKSLQRLTQRTKTIVGTVEYSAPEVFALQTKQLDEGRMKRSLIPQSDCPGYDYKCDIWSLGIMIHIMLSGISPFYNESNELGMVQSAMLGKLDLQRRQWQGVSLDAKNFVRKLIQIDPNSRFNTQDCLKHEWILKRKCQLEHIYKKKILQQ